MFERLLIIAAILLCLLAVVSCDDNKSGGGGGQSQTGTSQTASSNAGPVVIRGLTTVSSRGTTIYKAVVADNGGTAINWQWSIQGHAAIAGPTDQREVEVDITGPEGGGEFTLSLKVKIAKGPWLPVQKKVTVSPYPQFRVVVNDAQVGSLSPASLTGSGTMVASQEYTEYKNWSLYFVGNTTTFPNSISVEIFANNGCAQCPTNWANGVGANTTQDFPKQGGGTVGLNGTVYDSGANRPDLRSQPSPNYNYLDLRADGVKDMSLVVHR